MLCLKFPKQCAVVEASTGKYLCLFHECRRPRHGTGQMGDRAYQLMLELYLKECLVLKSKLSSIDFIMMA